MTVPMSMGVRDKWVTRDGCVMTIEEMEDRHLQNCIAKIFVSGGSWRGHWLPVLLDELEKRKSAAESA